MATTSISGLPETTVINNLTVGPFDYAGGTYKVTVATLGSFILNNGTTVSVTGNVNGGNVLVNGVTLSTNTVSAAGNIIGGNILVSGVTLSTNTVSATGTVSGGNLQVSGVLVSTNTVSATGNITGGNINTSGLLSTVANVNGGNLIAVNNVNAATVTGGNLVATNSLTVNAGNVATAIVNGAANAQGNIGSVSSYFKQIFAQATTALYADLAEVYEADADYAPGTVVSFGGSKEVTCSTRWADPAVAGVISANPSYLMNNGLTADHRAIVALTGRVPTKVTGTVYKGSMMIAAGDGRAMACATPAMGTVIGKALENFDGESGIIEIVVGRM
jgi:hypothetical protein